MSHEAFRRDLRIDDAELAARYDEVTQDLLANCPVARSSAGYALVTRHSDVRRCALDPAFSVRDGVLQPRPAGLPMQYPQEADPPLHTQIRHALFPHFTATRVASYRVDARAVADELIDAFLPVGSCDAVASYARVFPGRVVFRCMLGLPDEQVATLGKAVYRMFSGHPKGMAQFDAGVERVLRFHELEQPDNALMATILDLELDGAPADRSVRKSIVSSLIVGGLETTSSVLAQAIFHLGTHSADRDRLAAEPDGLPAAVEEFLRLYAPAWALGRTVTAVVEVADEQFGPGDFVFLGWGTGSRDPRIFDDPLRWDADRAPNPHLAFGIGRHFCLGAHLARLELAVGLEALLERVVGFTVAPGFEPRYSAAINRTIASVPIVFEAAA